MTCARPESVRSFLGFVLCSALSLTVGCNRNSQLGNFTLEPDTATGSMVVSRGGEVLFELEGVDLGVGEATITHQFGSYLFEDESVDWVPGSRWKVLSRSGDQVMFATVAGDQGQTSFQPQKNCWFRILFLSPVLSPIRCHRSESRDYRFRFRAGERAG